MNFYNFWTPENSAENVIYAIADFDILGVGSFREQQLRELLKNSRRIDLYIHPRMIPEGVREIYNIELEVFSKKYPTIQIREAEQFDFQDLQNKLFRQVFPLTLEALGHIGNRIQDAYQKEVSWDGWLAIDYWRYFVGYLRSKFPDQNDLISLAHWEWVHAWVQVQPFTFDYYGEQDVVEVNPSLQTVILAEDIPVLSRAKGLYGVWYSSLDKKVINSSLSLTQALFLDLLNEDRNYSKNQLLEMAETYLQKKDSDLSKDILSNKISGELEDLFEKNLLK